MLVKPDEAAQRLLDCSDIEGGPADVCGYVLAAKIGYKNQAINLPSTIDISSMNIKKQKGTRILKEVNLKRLLYEKVHQLVINL